MTRVAHELHASTIVINSVVIVIMVTIIVILFAIYIRSLDITNAGGYN